MFKVKICGITSVEDALLAAEAGADAIGLNFYRPSPRAIEPEMAQDIVQHLRRDYPAEKLEIYAVFVNATLDEISWTFRTGDLYGICQLAGIQLHGDEPPEFLAELKEHALGGQSGLLQASGRVPKFNIVRAFRNAGGSLADASAYLNLCRKFGAMPDAALVDAHQPGTYGGTGKPVDWDVVRRDRAALGGLPVILAGGLTAENVAGAITAARPDAVDVASGVELAPGTKDPEKVRRFVAAAKRAFTASLPGLRAEN
jgi:phosphoribosylanthranilate isomerase